jgi:hypothetical protein
VTDHLDESWNYLRTNQHFTSPTYVSSTLEWLLLGKYPTPQNNSSQHAHGTCDPRGPPLLVTDKPRARLLNLHRYKGEDSLPITTGATGNRRDSIYEPHGPWRIIRDDPSAKILTIQYPLPVPKARQPPLPVIIEWLIAHATDYFSAYPDGTHVQLASENSNF